MKKLLMIMFTMLFTCSVLVGCSDNLDECPDTPGNEYENLVTSDIVYDEDKKLLSFNSINNDDSVIVTNLSYVIEKYDDEWVKTDLTDGLMFAQIALMIEPNSFIMEKVDLSHINSLDDGCYRIVKDYNTDDGNVELYIQFDVKSNELTNFSTYNEFRK